MAAPRPASQGPAQGTAVVKDRAWWADRLMRYYIVRNPTQATPDEIGIVLDRFEKPNMGYDKMWDLLTRKYGPEPSRPVRSTLRDRDWWADRLLRFYMARNPTQATPEQIQLVLDRFDKPTMGFDKMWDMLTKKYGPEPVELVKDRAWWADRLLKYYTARNPTEATPEQVEQVLDTFAKQKMDYDQMWVMALQKFGPDPNELVKDRAYWADRLMRYNTVRNPTEAAPEKIEKVLDTCDKQKMGYDQMWDAQTKKFGPEPVAQIKDRAYWAARLLRYFALRNPTHATENRVKLVIDHFDVPGQSFDVMWAQLLHKYGPEPPEDPEAIPKYRERLVRFFQKHARPKLVSVDEIVEKTFNEEKGIFENLVHKYGPEPATDRAFWAERMLRYNDVRNPTQATAEQIELVLDRFDKPGKGFDEMWESLTKQYGPDPIVKDRAYWADRLMRYYAAMNPTDATPEKIEQVLDTCDRKNMSYEKLWEPLTRKYGPDPVLKDRAYWANRVMRYFAARNPTQATEDQVNAVLNQFDLPDKFEKMWELTRKKYGPEPIEAPTKAFWAERLLRFYKLRNPAQATVEQVAYVLDKLETTPGFEKMWPLLIKKYGREVGAISGPHRDRAYWSIRVLHLFAERNPAEATPQQVEVYLTNHDVEEGGMGWDQMYADLEKKYPPIPKEGTPAWWANRVRRYYTVRNPSQASEAQVAAVMKKFEKLGYEKMWEMLLLKYGEPPGELEVDAINSALAKRAMWQSRLTRYFVVRHPPSATEEIVSQWLARYGHAGYDHMWDVVREKYGPDPTERVRPVPNLLTNRPDAPPDTPEPAVAAPPTVFVEPPPVQLKTSLQRDRETLAQYWPKRYQKYLGRACPDGTSAASVEVAVQAAERTSYSTVWATLLAKYGPEVGDYPPPPVQRDAAWWVERMMRFYAVRQPSNAVRPKVELIVDSVGEEGWEEVWKALIAKYGPEPEDTGAVLEEWRAKLTKFLLMHNPAEGTPAKVNAYLAEFAPWFEEMMDHVQSKYAGHESTVHASKRAMPTVAPAWDIVSRVPAHIAHAETLAAGQLVFSGMSLARYEDAGPAKQIRFVTALEKDISSTLDIPQNNKTNITVRRFSAPCPNQMKVQFSFTVPPRMDWATLNEHLGRKVYTSEYTVTATRRSYAHDLDGNTAHLSLDSGMIMGARDFTVQKDYVAPYTDHTKVARVTLQPPLYHPTPGRRPEALRMPTAPTVYHEDLNAYMASLAPADLEYRVKAMRTGPTYGDGVEGAPYSNLSLSALWGDRTLHAAPATVNPDGTQRHQRVPVVQVPTTLREAANAEARKPQHLSFLPSTDRVGQSSAHTGTTDRWNRPPSYTQVVAQTPSPPPPARPNDEWFYHAHLLKSREASTPFDGDVRGAHKPRRPSNTDMQP